LNAFNKRQYVAPNMVLVYSMDTMLSSIELFSLLSPKDVQDQLAADVKRSRVEVKGWKRDTLAEKSGVPASTIKRFERSGEISLRQLLMLVHALGLLDRFDKLLKNEIKGMRMDEYIKQNEHKPRIRGMK